MISPHQTETLMIQRECGHKEGIALFISKTSLSKDELKAQEKKLCNNCFKKIYCGK